MSMMTRRSVLSGLVAGIGAALLPARVASANGAPRDDGAYLQRCLDTVGTIPAGRYYFNRRLMLRDGNQIHGSQFTVGPLGCIDWNDARDVTVTRNRIEFQGPTGRFVGLRG